MAIASVINGKSTEFRSRLATALGAATLTLASSVPAFAATPDDNIGLSVAHGSLVGAHAAGVAGGLAVQGYFGVGFEVAAYAADVSLKATPPVFEIPNNLLRLPNAPGVGRDPRFQCVYRFNQPVIHDGMSATIEDDYASILGVPFNPIDAVWGDLGKPFVYHGQADVAVRVRHPRFATSSTNPEFPAGVHKLPWEAVTRINAPIDIGIPSALLALSAYSEYRSLAKAKAGTKPSNRARLLEFLADLALEVGIPGVTNSDPVAASDWYERNSFDSTGNRATQELTVWDINVPYIRDARNPAGPIAQQAVQLEATDFGGVRFGRVEENLKGFFLPTDDCANPMVVTTPTSPRRLLPITDQANPDDCSAPVNVGTPAEIEWEIAEVINGPYRPGENIRANQTQNGSEITTAFTQSVRVVDTQPPILVPPPGFARESDAPVDLTISDFPLGRPRVVDLADPAPRVSNDAPAMLELDRRYTINWAAQDASCNQSVPGVPTQFAQIVTVKTPGTNTATHRRAALCRQYYVQYR